MQPVVRLMREQGWFQGCLYNQETNEDPQLYFDHMLKTGDAYALASEIRRGLDLTDTDSCSGASHRANRLTRPFDTFIGSVELGTCDNVISLPVASCVGGRLTSWRFAVFPSSRRRRPFLRGRRDRTDMTVSTDQPCSTSSLYAAISNAIVRLLRDYTGRGPTKARTTIRDNVVVVMLEQTLTKGEQSLVAKGRGEKVIEIRHEFQEALREESSAKIAELTGRHVTAMLSANHIDPDLGAEIYVLDGPPDHDARRWETVAEVAVTAAKPN